MTVMISTADYDAIREALEHAMEFAALLRDRSGCDGAHDAAMAAAGGLDRLEAAKRNTVLLAMPADAVSH